MKKLFAVLIVISVCAFGCTILKADYAKLTTKVESINWSAALTYWQDFVKGLNGAAPVATALLKNDTATVGKIVTAVADANAAVTTLNTAVTAYKAGTLTEANAVSAAQVTETAVVAASKQIGAIIKPAPAPAAAK